MKKENGITIGKICIILVIFLIIIGCIFFIFKTNFI